MRAVDFPRWMRALLALTLILLFCELIVLIAPIPHLLQTWSWKIDPGIATLIGAIVGLYIVGMQARAGFSNLIRSQEHHAAIERQTVKFSKWHEKRIGALIDIYGAFIDYLDFLRRRLYFDWPPGKGPPLDPMHEFQRKIDKLMVYLDDPMAETISRYQGELARFWNDAMSDLRSGEEGRERVQKRLDFEIPAYQERLRRDINAFLDPHYTPTWIHPRLAIAEDIRRGVDPFSLESHKGQ